MNLDTDDHDVDGLPATLCPLHEHDKDRSQREEIIIKIVAAEYGPCEGMRLLSGELNNDQQASIPYTRDVTPFLRALLITQRNKERETNEVPEADEDEDFRVVRLSALQAGMKRTQVRLDISSMNGVFGDPCPGTSKRLSVDYVMMELTDRPTTLAQATAAEVHHLSFAEHEQVVLRRQVRFYQEEERLKQAAARTLAQAAEDEDESMLQAARRLGRSQSIAEFAQDVAALNGLRVSDSKVALLGGPLLADQISVPTESSPERNWRLRSATSEIVLPIVMPFLQVKERMQCRLVCQSWRNIVEDWGVATTIDNSDPAFPRFTRAFFRGLISHSYSSLQSLFLSGFEDLQKSDFHPAIPHLRKLRSLDVSRCIELDDETLELLSEHCSETLQVLYIKGLRKVTDAGLISICRSCANLQVLEISNIPCTDQAGIAIGENLGSLRALYMRDNYQLTNASIDVITEKCTQLEQLTLWGCTKLKHLRFDSIHEFAMGKLTMLNLWGCHSLRDDAAGALAGMINLHSLNVSECHRLSDKFVIYLCEHVPSLRHLYLRYCKRVSDEGVRALALRMQNLYALDLSFCTKVTAAAIVFLLEARGDSLAELRLLSCQSLAIGQENAGGQAGCQVVNALKASECALSVLDVRLCGGQPSLSQPYVDIDPFVQGMKSLGFTQKVAGFFSRPARWNMSIRRRLVEQLATDELSDAQRKGS